MIGGSMDAATLKRLTDESLSGSWLSSRLAISSQRVDAMRRAGELFGVRPDGSGDWYFPAWQFDAAGRPRDVVARIVAAARSRGLDDARLYEVMTMRQGLGGTGRLSDALRAGRDEDVLRSIRQG
jgi:hypothetical protein